MGTVTVPKVHVEKAISEMQRYANAYENYLKTGGFQEMDTFLEFAAEVENIKAAIAALEASL